MAGQIRAGAGSGHASQPLQRRACCAHDASQPPSCCADDPAPSPCGGGRALLAASAHSKPPPPSCRHAAPARPTRVLGPCGEHRPRPQIVCPLRLRPHRLQGRRRRMYVARGPPGRMPQRTSKQASKQQPQRRHRCQPHRHSPAHTSHTYMYSPQPSASDRASQQPPPAWPASLLPYQPPSQPSPAATTTRAAPFCISGSPPPLAS